MTKFKMSKVLPKLVEKYKTLSPSELKAYILSDYNKEVTPESITMFFKRHAEIEQQLKALVNETVQAEIEVSDALFENGTFEQLPSIKKWNIEKATRVSPLYQSGHISALKRICQGYYCNKDNVTGKEVKVYLPNWTLKSPERLSIEQVKEFIAAVHKAGKITNIYRMAARDFFLSRDNITIKPTDISGEMGKLGKWKYVFVEKAILEKILEFVKLRSFQAYVADYFMYKTATRSAAANSEVLKCKLRQSDDNTWEMEITDKGFHRKGRQVWNKLITSDLKALLDVCWSQCGDNAFAGISEVEIRELNKEAYKSYLTEDKLAFELAMAEPNHFWRHMFAQHMLRATNWNYDAVAILGGWSGVDMLKKIYGAPPMEMIRKLGVQVVPQI